MLAVNRCEHGGDLVAQHRGEWRRSREYSGDLEAHLAQRGGHLRTDEAHADHHSARARPGDLTDRSTLRERAQLIAPRQARSGYRKVPVSAAGAEHQLVVVHRLSTGESQLLEGGIHLPHGGPGAQLNVVLAIPFGGLDVPGSEVFLTSQVRFGKRRTAERDARLRAQEHDATPPSLFSQGHGRIAAGQPGTNNDHDLLSCCLSIHRKASSRSLLAKQTSETKRFGFSEGSWSYLFFEEGLCLGTDLKDTHAPHIQPVASLHLRHADERGIADGATDDRPHPMHVGGGRPKQIGGAAARAGDLDERHFKGEDRLQHARGSVAIQFVFHHASPVGPNRSVLMRAGSCPSVTRLAAAVSTNGVGPQMYIRGC